ncbi:MAG: TlpA disulfide reductase family protein [Bacteroidota bacterium]
MDNLEKWFMEHKQELDPLKASGKSWEAVESSLGKKGTLPVFKLKGWMKVAAVFAILLSTVLLWQTWEQKTELAIHNVLPDVALENPEGEVVRISDLDSKVVLVNFWASWNEACHENNCYVFKPIYEKYKEMGFEIYGISIDSDREEWLVSILEDELPWVHVSDLQSWQSPIARGFDVTTLPTSFLVDEDRRIIARDLNAEELEKTLEELLAYN